ncbi:hypothetical protein [Massilia eburnea]|uniref:hypothetical protein n=1 Tax=Massilia eburnea TaxID=1776165 RepID=UPI003D6BC475
MTILAIAGFLVATTFAVNCLLFDPRTGLSDYDQSVAPWRDSYTSFFPKPIPVEASQVRYFHRPAMMQGGEHIQLRMVLPAASVRNIQADAVRNALSRTAGMRPGDDRKELMPRPGGVKGHADYQVFVLNSSRTEDNWNHYLESGVAVSTKYNEVVYWFENW